MELFPRPVCGFDDSAPMQFSEVLWHMCSVKATVVGVSKQGRTLFSPSLCREGLGVEAGGGQ